MNVLKNKPYDFTLGADPEFACTNNQGEVLAANLYVPANDLSEFGADGNGATYEIRPAASKDPLEIVGNIHDIFTRQILAMPQFLDFKWISGSYYNGYTFGGHVHFGVPTKVINHTEATGYLDQYMGSLSLLMEVREHGLQRRTERHHYGRMGDIRPQPWGFEYRTMSSWVCSPYVASAMLCLSKTIMYEVINNPKFTWHKFVNADDFVTMNQTKIRTQFPKIWEDITNMTLYQVYKPYIDMIYFLVKNKLSWIPTTDIKESWGIVDMTKNVNNKIGLDILWHRYNNGIQNG